MARVKIVYGSVLDRLAGATSEFVELPDRTVAGLLREVGRRHGPSLAERLVDGKGALFPGASLFANGTAATLNTALSDGDEIVILLNLEGG